MNITKEKLREIAEELYAEAEEDVKDMDEESQKFLLTIHGVSIKNTQNFIEKIFKVEE